MEWMVVLFICAGVYGYSEQREKQKWQEKANALEEAIGALAGHYQKLFSGPSATYTFTADDGTKRYFEIREVDGSNKENGRAAVERAVLQS
jgi:hypothetical protein